MKTVNRWISERPWASRGIRTFLQAFLGLLVPGALGFLNGLTQWASSEGQSPFPDATSFAFVGVNAIVAGVIAIITSVWVKTEDATGRALFRKVPADTGTTPQP